MQTLAVCVSLYSTLPGNRPEVGFIFYSDDRTHKDFFLYWCFGLRKLCPILSFFDFWREFFRTGAASIFASQKGRVGGGLRSLCLLFPGRFRRVCRKPAVAILLSDKCIRLDTLLSRTLFFHASSIARAPQSNDIQTNTSRPFCLPSLVFSKEILH